MRRQPILIMNTEELTEVMKTTSTAFVNLLHLDTHLNLLNTSFEV